MALKFLGIEGVGWDDEEKKFVAFVELEEGKWEEIGRFDTAHAASQAHKEASKDG